MRKRKKEYRTKNKKQLKEYRVKNKTRITKYKTKYDKERIKVDPQFRMIRCLRSRIRGASEGTSRSQSTKQLIGVDFRTFTKWIEYQLSIGYTMDDVATKKVHLDHVIPLSSFNLLDENELQKACSWTNIRPLESNKNLQKSNKVDPWLLICQEVKAHYFLKTLTD